MSTWPIKNLKTKANEVNLLKLWQWHVVCEDRETSVWGDPGPGTCFHLLPPQWGEQPCRFCPQWPDWGGVDFLRNGWPSWRRAESRPAIAIFSSLKNRQEQELMWCATPGRAGSCAGKPQGTACSLKWGRPFRAVAESSTKSWKL